MDLLNDQLTILPRKRLSLKLFGVVLLAGMVTTILFVSISLFIDNSIEMDNLNLSWDKIEQEVIIDTTRILWDSDVDQIEKHLDSLLNLDNVIGVWITNKNKLKSFDIKKRHFTSYGVTEHRYPLTISQAKKSVTLGMLHLLTNKNNIYARLTKKSIYIFLVQGVKAFILVCITYFFLMLYIKKSQIRVATEKPKKLEVVIEEPGSAKPQKTDTKYPRRKYVASRRRRKISSNARM